jgi:hypothetical protein
MTWLVLGAFGLILWGASGSVIALGRQIWPVDMTLGVHLVIAPVIAGAVTTAHKIVAPEFSPLLTAAALTGVVIALDALVVAPLFERSYAMFRNPLATWLPFAAIFLVSWATGALLPA